MGVPPSFRGVLSLGLGFFTAAFISLIVLLGLGGQTSGIRFLMVLLLLVPASQLSLEVVNYLVTRSLPPRTLPKMDFEKSGIPDEFRTLVVVPMLLVDAQAIRDEVDKLEIRYLANKEDNLLFGLFSDYTDSKQAHGEEDEPSAPGGDRRHRSSQSAGTAASVSSSSIGSERGANPNRSSSDGSANAASWKSSIA